MEKQLKEYHYEIYLEIKTLLIGFAYLFILISASFIYSWFFKDNIPKPPQLLYNENNELLGKAPFRHR